MIIEKLVQYDDPPLKIYRKLQQAWQDRGYEIVDRQDKQFIIHSSGRSYSRVRVDVLTQCFELGAKTLVQMVYSPRLTPPVSRSVNISPVGQKKIHSDLEIQMMAVLDKAGKWSPMTRESVEEMGVVLSDSYLLNVPNKGSARRLRLFAGLGIAVLGAAMSYLNLNGILALGASGLWFIIAVAGVFMFCLELFNLIWGR